MTTTQNLTVAIVACACLAVSAFFVSATPAHAATNDAKFMELKSQLELLRANLMQMRTGSSTRASSTRATVDRSCMQQAVNTRENSIMDAGYTYAAAMRTAMNTRKDAFATVWTGTNVSNQSTYKQIWSQWKRDSDAARKKLQNDRKNAWKTFQETAAKTCKATLPKEETEKQDASTSAL